MKELDRQYAILCQQLGDNLVKSEILKVNRTALLAQVHSLVAQVPAKQSAEPIPQADKEPVVENQ